MSKIKIMLSSPMRDKSKEEIDNERNEMANLIFDYFGDGNCEITSSVIENHKEKSELECFSESIFFMSQADILAMGFGWENARGCRLEHQIAKEYGMDIIYLSDLKKELVTERRYSDGKLAKWYYSTHNVISDGNKDYYLRSKEKSETIDKRIICGTNQLLDDLNELSDENEQLKQSIKSLRHRHSLLHDQCLEFEHKNSKLQNDIICLEEENKQLEEKSVLVNECCQMGRVWDLIDEAIDTYENVTTNDDVLQIQIDTKLETLYNLKKRLKE